MTEKVKEQLLAIRDRRTWGWWAHVVVACPQGLGARGGWWLLLPFLPHPGWL